MALVGVCHNIPTDNKGERESTFDTTSENKGGMVKFTIKERILMMSLFPPQAGDLTTLKLVRQFRENLSFTEFEHKKLEIKTDGQRASWNPAYARETKNIEVGPVMRQLIVQNFRNMARRTAEAKKAGLDLQQVPNVLMEDHLPFLEGDFFPEAMELIEKDEAEAKKAQEAKEVKE